MGDREGAEIEVLKIRDEALGVLMGDCEGAEIEGFTIRDEALGVSMGDCEGAEIEVFAIRDEALGVSMVGCEGGERGISVSDFRFCSGHLTLRATFSNLLRIHSLFFAIGADGIKHLKEGFPYGVGDLRIKPSGFD